jgi:hypothetical protein
MSNLDEKRTLRTLLALLGNNQIEKAKEILVKELKEDSNEKVKFNKTQTIHIEAFFTELQEQLEGLQSINKILKESIIGSYGEQNKNISVFDIEHTLNTIDKILDPINTEMNQLATCADYLLWDYKNSFSMWDKIEDTIKFEIKKQQEV